MSDEIDEMSPDLRELLDAERERPGPSPADRDALRAGLGTLLDGPKPQPPEGGGGGDGGGASDGGGGAAGSALGKLAAVFAAGAITGGIVVWSVAPRTVEVRTNAPASSAPVASIAPGAVVASSAPPIESAAPALASSSSPSPRASAPSAKIAPSAANVENRDEELASERAMLERARVALGRGDATGALDTLDRHAARHPSGRLAEEREVLAVQALVSAGRKDEAVARASRFHAKYPKSAFGAAVDALVR